jgi:hypothetical protein
MASLRFRFPWAAFLAPLGYAALAFALAWPLLDDFHGHLRLRAAVNAAGAALAALVVWRYGERLTDFVNLHTGPLLRLGLGGLAAIWLATQWTGLFGEFAVGTAAWWPNVATSLLFVVLTLPPALALVTLLTALETAFAARRGGGGVAEAVRPIGRHCLVATLVAALLGYVVVMQPLAPDRVALALAPDRARESGWIEREQRLFRQVAAGWGCEVLVVPPESAAAAIDRPARSLIARYLAAELAARGTQCVADPTLVARALGARARQYAAGRVLALADALGATTLVRIEVRMAPEQPAFTLALRVARRGTAAEAWSAVEETQWGPIAFSDELPPETGFAYIAAEVADALGLELQDAAEPVPPAEEGGRLQLSLAGLTHGGDKPLPSAQALQLLAATYHPSEVAGEHLWERSLVALSVLPAADPAARALRARAALHLRRRPHALALLEGIDTAEAQGVRAIADGNLAAAAKLAGEIANPPARLVLQLELEALRSRYGKSTGAEQRRKAALDSYPGLAALLYVPFSGGLPQQWEPLLALELEQRATAIAQPLLAGVVAPLARAVGVNSPAGEIEAGYAPTWRLRAGEWRAQRAYDRVAEWDAFDALHAANRAALLLQARAAGEARQVVALGRSLPGHPAIAAALAAALESAPDPVGPPGLGRERGRRLARDVLAWEGGETEIERDLRARMRVTLPPVPADEPPRAWRVPGPGDAQAAAGERALAALRLERYAQSDFEVLHKALELCERAGDVDCSTRLAHEALARFRGSPARDAFLLARAQSRRDLAGLVRLWSERIEDEGEHWQHFEALARTFLRAHQPDAAQGAILAFPPIATGATSARAGALAAALAGGELLARAGESELARLPLTLAAQPGSEVSGGVPQLRARALLAQLDADWRAMRDLALLLHAQGQDERALAQAAMASFLLGQTEDGWRSFYEASKRFEHHGPWEAALAGHRVEATKPDEAIAFAKRWKSLSGSAAVESRLRGRFVFNLLLVDRPPADWALEALTEFAAERRDEVLAAHARGYTAFKRGGYALVVQTLLPLQEAGKADPAVLPWIALALTQSGDTARAQALAGPSFHGLLASAYLSASTGAIEASLDALWDAFLALPPAPAAAPPLIPPGYQLLETCERLYALTGEARYRDLLVDLARRQQRTWPDAWAYAFDAHYSAHADDRERALGAALFLDAESEQLRDFTQDQRQRAAARFAVDTPFRRG